MKGPSRPVSRFVLLMIGALSSGAVAMAAEPAARTRFDIDRQSLSAALNECARQGDLEILFSPDLVGALKTDGVRGEYTVMEALERLLSGTGLRYRITDSNTILIEPPSRAKAVTSANAVDGARIRLAQAQESRSVAGQSASAADESAAEQATVIGDVLVTAQKREQSIKDVPISITAISAEELEARRVTEIGDIIATVPNISFVNAGAYWGQQVSIRGVNPSGGLAQVTSVMLDDTSFGALKFSDGYYSLDSNSLLNNRLLDIERIEVLRGPQGTLTGRNSLGGAINIVTAKPNLSKLSAQASLDYGRFDSVFAKGVLNAPISQGVAAIRASAFVEDSRGAVRNIGPSGGTSSRDNYGGRIALRVAPSDNFTVDAAFAYQRLRRGHDDAIIDAYRNEPVRSEMLADLESWGGDMGRVDYLGDVGNDGGVISTDVDQFTRAESKIGSLRASYDFGSYSAALLLGDYRSELQYRDDYDQTEYAWWLSNGTGTSRSHSAELRFTSKLDGPVNWVAGASYLTEKGAGSLQDSAGDWLTQGGTPRLAGNYTPTYLGHGTTKLESAGAFANLFWDIGRRTHLSIGGRFSHETINSADRFIYEEGNPDLQLPVIGPDDRRAQATASEFSPRIAVNFDLTANVTTYVQYATGFRTGYGNKAFPISVGAQESVEPEHLKNYEVGLKGNFLDSRATLGLAAFYMDYRDLQTEAELDPSLHNFPFTIFYDTNAGSAHVQGFELESRVRPVMGLTLSGAVGYADAVIDELVLEDVDLKGDKIPGIRPWTASLSATYDRPITANVQGRIRADYTWQDALNPQYETDFAPRDSDRVIPSFDTLDLSVGALFGRWNVALYADNVLDEKYTSFRSRYSQARRGQKAFFTPRSYGIQITASF